MIIRFTKGRGGSDILTCLRDDGSITWSPSSIGTPHDLLHYVVETTLGYRSAFFGLLAQGRDINSFGTRAGVKDVYPSEALWAETIVGFLQAEMLSGRELTSVDFEGMLASHFGGQPRPEGLTDGTRKQLRFLTWDLIERWGAIPADGTLELPFPL